MYTHLISALDVFLCIPLHLLSSCTSLAFFDNPPPCPTSLNIVLYPSHWQPPLTVPRQKRQHHFHSDAGHLSRTFLLSPQSCPTNPRIPPTPSSLQSRSTIPLTVIRFEFMYPCILFPNTGKIPDNIICPILACLVGPVSERLRSMWKQFGQLHDQSDGQFGQFGRPGQFFRHLWCQHFKS